MFHLVKARQWEGTVYCADEVNGLGIFQGVCADHRVWVRTNVCCVRVLEAELRDQRQNSLQ